MCGYGRIISIVALLVVAGCSGVAVDPVADGGTPRPDAPPAPEPEATVTVLRAVDGDTLKVRFDDGTEDTLRLIGVDTPETDAENTPAEFEGVPETTAGRDCLRRWGEAASERMKQLEGKRVGLAFDPALDRRGYYGRLLTYVVHDGESVNYGLVADGYARVYDSGFSRGEAYYAAETAAMDAGAGLWECATESPETGTTTATSSITLEIHADAAGDDTENLNDEYVTLTNQGDEPLELAGWTVTDEAGHTYEFGPLTLPAGEDVRLHTGAGNDTETDVYWGQSTAVWNNGGDTVTVRDATGAVVVEQSY